MRARARRWWHQGPEKQDAGRAMAGTNRRRFTSDADMHALYRSIDYLIPRAGAKIIQFIGVKGGEGVSTVVRELAATASQIHQKRVLILDAAHHNPSQHEHFSVESAYGWIEAFREKEPLVKACYPLDEHTLYLSPISSDSALTTWYRDEESSSALFRELKDSFDLVLIDSAPALVSVDSLTTCRFCDGVVLVFEAGKNWRLAETARKKIIDNGGSILGVVFNKRTLYIPEFIYRHLY